MLQVCFYLNLIYAQEDHILIYKTIFSKCISHYGTIIKFIFFVHCCCTDLGFYILGFTFSASKPRIHHKYYSNHIQLVLHSLFYDTVYILKAPRLYSPEIHLA